MMDFARSDNPLVQAQLDRLGRLSVPQGRFGLETIAALMERLGNPHRALPPVFHVAGTNGKGSTCAFLRAMLEADGKRVHVTTSPHLVRYNERIRISGALVGDTELAALLAEVLEAGDGLGPSFFEVTIAAAFLAFSREPADACVVEVGMGGRFDATNVLQPEALAVCGIAALGLDHEKFLLAPEEGVPKDPIARIAFEKAGIAKSGVPLVTMGESYPWQARSAIREVAADRCAPLLEVHSDEIDAAARDASSLLGTHQIANLALARAMIRAQAQIAVGEAALEMGARQTVWPARLQRLASGPLAGDRETWLDGGHNPSAGEMVAAHFADRPLHLILGMLDNKDPRALLGPLGDRVRSLTIVPVPGHDSHPPSAFGPDARAAVNLKEALQSVPSGDYPVLIAGSLYLAGEALRLNDEIPD
ncbi:MAG: folylpolyglutamate synthase/dihydrofolate synthase family protein [Erythrobacter sp.]